MWNFKKQKKKKRVHLWEDCERAKWNILKVNHLKSEQSECLNKYKNNDDISWEIARDIMNLHVVTIWHSSYCNLLKSNFLSLCDQKIIFLLCITKLSQITKT